MTVRAAVNERLGEDYVTDDKGKVLVMSNPSMGVKAIDNDENISARFPETATVFSTSVRRLELDESSSFMARRVQLDPLDASCSFVILQRLFTAN